MPPTQSIRCACSAVNARAAVPPCVLGAFGNVLRPSCVDELAHAADRDPLPNSAAPTCPRDAHALWQCWKRRTRPSPRLGAAPAYTQAWAAGTFARFIPVHGCAAMSPGAYCRTPRARLAGGEKPSWAAVNPDGVVAQVEGGAIQSHQLGAARKVPLWLCRLVRLPDPEVLQKLLRSVVDMLLSDEPFRGRRQK